MDNLRRFGNPRSDLQRLFNHFGKKQAIELLRTYGNEAFNLLPERGSRFTMASISFDGNPHALQHRVDGRNYSRISESIDEDVSGVKEWLQENIGKLQNWLADIQSKLEEEEENQEPELPESKTFLETIADVWYIPVGIIVIGYLLTKKKKE